LLIFAFEEAQRMPKIEQAQFRLKELIKGIFKLIKHDDDMMDKTFMEENKHLNDLLTGWREKIIPKFKN